MTRSWQRGRLSMAVLVASTALALGACRGDRGETDRTDRVADRAADRTDEAGDKLNAAWVTAKIQAKYFGDEAVKGRDIDVDTNNGVVTLSGQVDSEQARQRAVQIARDTDGVARVEDRLTLTAESSAVPTSGSGAPASPPPFESGRTASTTPVGSDEDILTRVQARFFAREPLRHSGVAVSASEGVVTLAGEVDSESLHQEALSIAAETPGVQRVEDRVEVSAPAGPGGTGGDIAPVPPAPAPAPSAPAATPPEGSDADEWIATQIQARYFQDVLVKDAAISVSASGGTVTLQGRAPSDAARQQAVRIAKEIPGVTQVEDKLTVGVR